MPRKIFIKHEKTTIGVKKFAEIQKQNCITAARLKKEYGFTAAQIRDLDTNPDIGYILKGTLKYYDMEDVGKYL